MGYRLGTPAADPATSLLPEAIWYGTAQGIESFFLRKTSTTSLSLHSPYSPLSITDAKYLLWHSFTSTTIIVRSQIKYVRSCHSSDQNAQMSSHIILSKSPHTDLLHDFPHYLCPQILPVSLPLPTSLLQPHSLLTVWQHQSHLTSELLPSTWVFFPQRATWFIPYLWVIVQMLASQWGHPWPRHIKKHLSTPSPRYSKVTSSRKSLPNFSFSSSTSKWKNFSSFQVPLSYFPCDLLVLPLYYIYWGLPVPIIPWALEGKELCLLPFCFL